MREHVRSRPHYGHVAQQNIEELRKLVQAGPAQKRAHFGNPRIILGGLHFIRFLVDVHRSKLETGKGLIVPARTLLHKKDGAARIQLDQEHQDGKQP